jgi:hypothetical protein
MLVVEDENQADVFAEGVHAMKQELKDHTEETRKCIQELMERSEELLKMLKQQHLSQGPSLPLSQGSSASAARTKRAPFVTEQVNKTRSRKQRDFQSFLVTAGMRKPISGPPHPLASNSAGDTGRPSLPPLHTGVGCGGESLT